MSRLLYIKSIDYCEAYHLRRIMVIEQTRLAVIKDLMPWQARLTTANLTATLSYPITINHKNPLAFRLTDVQNRRYLLGMANPPFPQTTTNCTIGNSVQNDKMCQIKIRWTTLFSLGISFFRNELLILQS